MDDNILFIVASSYVACC